MESIFIILLKSSSILFLFLLSYHLFLKRETFFLSNRLFLMLGLVASFVLPFVTITKTIYVERAPMMQGDVVHFGTIVNAIEPETTFNWQSTVLVIYLLGVLVFGIRLILQLLAIRKIKKRGHVSLKDSCYHVKTDKWISPFSFFRYIFYFPQQFNSEELKSIIDHEKIHVRQIHSLDILFSEIVHVLQWFNPAIWLYKTALKQNLEFIADSQACGSDQQKKEYQYLMLKQATGNHKISIVNPFFNSLIKKRIVMLNQSKSKRINLLKLLFILPILGLFMAGFNTKEVVAFNDTPSLLETLPSPPISFISPVKTEDIKRISSGFGPARNPFTNDMDFHNGIDLVAKSGTKVLASAEGKVEISKSSAQNGNYIVLKHEDAYSTKYLHLEDRVVKAGDKVQKGQLIGHVGNTGKSTGPHLHFEVLQFKKPLNPESLIPFKSTNPRTTSLKTPKNQITKGETRFEFIIKKETTDEELMEMKAKLAQSDVDFSYTVVHNESNEIIDISVQVTGEGENGEVFKNSYNSSNNRGISPLVIFIDKENNLVSIGSKGSYSSTNTKITTDNNKIWISSGSGETKEVVIKKENGSSKVFINGEEVEKDELHEQNISIRVDSNEDEEGNVFIMKDSDDDSDIEVVTEEDGFFFIDTDGEGDPLYFIDGKKVTKEAVKELSPSQIKTMNVLKGKAARKKYGKAAKDGVIEITTKK